MCGCGRTSTPCPVTKSAGPAWSKKMNGPTICRCGEGKARRTSKPPRSRARGTMIVSMLSRLPQSGQVGSMAGFQLMLVSSGGSYGISSVLVTSRQLGQLPDSGSPQAPHRLRAIWQYVLGDSGLRRQPDHGSAGGLSVRPRTRFRRTVGAFARSALQTNDHQGRGQHCMDACNGFHPCPRSAQKRHGAGFGNATAGNFIRLSA